MPEATKPLGERRWRSDIEFFPSVRQGGRVRKGGRGVQMGSEESSVVLRLDGDVRIGQFPFPRGDDVHGLRCRSGGTAQDDVDVIDSYIGKRVVLEDAVGRRI